MKSEIMTCVQCRLEFEFTAKEQQLAEKMGFDIPKRCPECRKKKNKNAWESEGQKRKVKKRDYFNKDRD